jgi:competence protein ComEC
MPLFWLCLSFLAGIWLGSQFPLPTLTWVALAALALAFLLVGRILRQMVVNYPGLVRRIVSKLPPRQLRGILGPVNRLRAIRLGVALPWLVVALFLGAARYRAVQPVFTDLSISHFNDLTETVRLEGFVVADPDVRDGYILLDVQVERMYSGDVPEGIAVNGRLLARVETGPEIGVDWRYGDHLRLEGRLQTPGENELFSYRDYLEKRGIYSIMNQAQVELLSSGSGNPVLAGLYTLRQRSQAVLHRLYPDPEASLLSGILLGLERGIPANVSQAFQVTGTAHIIAISGYKLVM